LAAARLQLKQWVEKKEKESLMKKCVRKKGCALHCLEGMNFLTEKNSFGQNIFASPIIMG